MRLWVRRAAWAALAMLALAAAGELGLRLGYAWAERRTERFPLLYERVYWAVPPWVKSASILRPDPVLGLWMRPRAVRTYINLFGPIGDLGDLDRMFSSFLPELPAWAAGRPVWSLRTNSLGIRNREVDPRKPQGRLRIVVAGDSWTVGVNVDEADAFPQKLERLLQERFPGRDLEVVNYGRIGASAKTAAALLRERVWDLEPDLLVLAYGQNDEAGFHAAPPEAAPPRLLRRLLERSELYRLWAWRRESRTSSVSAALQEAFSTPWTNPENAPPEDCRRSGLADTPFGRAMAAAADSARGRDVGVLLLYNSLPDGKRCALAALQAVAARKRLPLVDSSSLIRAGALRLQAGWARQLGLAQGSRPGSRAGAVDVVFRVWAGTQAAAGTLSVSGGPATSGRPWLGRERLSDDGTHGDEKAADKVWSLRRSFAPGVDLAYVFEEEVPAATGASAGPRVIAENYWPRKYRTLPQDAGRLVYLPVARFGEQALRSDPFHTDRLGHELIARALLQSVLREPAFQRWLRSRP